MMAVPGAKTAVAVGLLLGTIAAISDGVQAQVFDQYPPSTVRGTRGDNLLLSVVVNGTDELDPIVIQGPNPITGSNKLVPIFERGTGQENPHEPFKGNFSVSTDWSGGVTVVNMTILDLQPGDVGTYLFNVAFHAGPGINVTMNELNDPNGVSTTVSPRTTTGSNVNTTEVTGSTSDGGLSAGAIAAIVIVLLFIAVGIAVGIWFYRRWKLGTSSRVPQEDYDPGNGHDRLRDHQDNGFLPEAQELVDMARNGRELGAEEVPLRNGVIEGDVNV